jgi:hypothetical protein
LPKKEERQLQSSNTHQEQVCSVAHGLGYIVIPACNLCLHFLFAEIIRLNILQLGASSRGGQSIWIFACFVD